MKFFPNLYWCTPFHLPPLPICSRGAEGKMKLMLGGKCMLPSHHHHVGQVLCCKISTDLLIYVPVLLCVLPWPPPYQARIWCCACSIHRLEVTATVVGGRVVGNIMSVG